MLKKILAMLAMLYAAASFAAVDVNNATAAELDGIKGVGPAISGKILAERKKGTFKDWNDFIARVPGIGEVNANKFSAEGMTVNGTGFKGAVTAPAKKADKRVAAKKDEPEKVTTKADTKPAAPEEAAAPKAETKKEARKKEAAKKDEKAEAAKPAASGTKK